MAEAPRSTLPGLSAQVLLGTKLYVPSTRPNLVSRPRLLAQLDQALSARLVLVSGPAGFGKTTLLAEWLRTRPSRACWLSLDASDNDPAKFLAYLIAALQTAVPHLAGDLAAPLRSPQPPAIDAVMPVLLNELCTVPEDLILVLDDFHVIASPAVNGAVAFLLENLPPQIHLAMVTRADPALPLARLRSRGQMVEIRVEDLRFTPSEAAEFLGRTMGLSLSSEQVASLEERTEGWIAGLQMAAISMRGRQDPSDFIASFTGSNRFVLDFLVEEVLGREPQEVQDFLLQTSVLDRLSGPLCDAVMGFEVSGVGYPGTVLAPTLSHGERESTETRNLKPDTYSGQAMLERLEKANLFVTSLDDERRWYRYHHLFGDLLRTRLRETQPELVPLLQSRAAMWFQGEGLVGEAMSYLLAAGSYERAAELAERSQLEMHRRSDSGFFLRVAELPEEVIRRRPWLSAFRGMIDVVWGRLEDAKRRLDQAESHEREGRSSAGDRDLASFLRLLRAYIAELEGRDSDMVDAAAEALESLAESKPSLRNTAGYWLGMTHFLHGDLGKAEETWTRLIQEDQRTGATNAILSAAARLATIRAIQGRLAEAAELCRKWSAWADEHGRWRFFRAGHLPETLGEILRERNRLEEALTAVEAGIKDNYGWRSAHSSAFGYAARARVLASMGRLEDAVDSLNELEGLTRGYALQPDVQWDLAACWVRLYLAKGDVRGAARWVNDGLPAESRPLGFRHERDGMSLARVLLAQGEHPKAHALLGRLEGAARLGGRTGSLIEILTLQARAFQAQKETAQALSVLGQALSLAEPEGYVRVFVDEGEPLADLLTRLAGLPASGAVPFSADYVRKLLSAFPQGLGDRGWGIVKSVPSPIPYPPTPDAKDSAPRAQHLVEPLSDRELEVLKLLAEGLTNQQIASRLIIAPGTVRAHVYNICGKLGAQNRTQAVARATELNLL